jgi:subtilase family serine protease
MDLEVLSLPDLIVEEIDVGSEPIRAGDILSIRVFVRNIGQAEATMISVRCEANSQLIDYDTIPVLQPGSVAYVTFDWQVPDNSTQKQLRAVIDRSSEISEGDEDNNDAQIAVSIEASLDNDDTSSDSDRISEGMFWGLTIVALLAIIGAFVFLTPPKIKKLQ